MLATKVIQSVSTKEINREAATAAAFETQVIAHTVLATIRSLIVFCGVAARCCVALAKVLAADVSRVVAVGR